MNAAILMAGRRVDKRADTVAGPGERKGWGCIEGKVCRLPSIHSGDKVVTEFPNFFSLTMAAVNNTTFPTTSWSLIRRVQQGGAADAAKAMEEICRHYWYPIYAFARRAGFAAHDAEDLTQVFFQRIITSETLQAAREEKGRLRTFMLSLLKRIISNHLRDASAEKRGGSTGATLSFDELDAEERFSHEPAGSHDPDALFDRAWAEGVLATAQENLRAEFAKAANLDGYAQLCEFLPLGENSTPYAEAAKRLNLAEGTLRLQIHRMRKRYGKLIEAQIALTVDSPDDVKTELTHLMKVMGREG